MSRGFTVLKSTVAGRDHRPKNHFRFSEFGGAIGDLGTTLPLAFALAIYNNFPVERLFLLWGIVYFVAGWWFRAPVSVQPLKAMAVIAITAGFSPAMLATTAVIYGVIFVIFALSGVIRSIHKIFTTGIVRGIQLGIGLLLAQKAFSLAGQPELYLGGTIATGVWLWFLFATALLLLVAGWYWLGPRAGLILIVLCITISVVPLDNPVAPLGDAPLLAPFNFQPEQWLSILTLLIIPQLPLTLGNSVYAANAACHELWGDQAARVSSSRLAASIGFSNIFIGLLGGFPVCHGAGGIVAHHRFGAQTGGATMILGTVLILLALTGLSKTLLFLIPVPVLAVLLLFNSWAMMAFTARLRDVEPVIVALLTGIVSFVTHNLTLAMVTGLAVEKVLLLPVVRNAIHVRSIQFNPLKKRVLPEWFYQSAKKEEKNDKRGT